MLAGVPIYTVRGSNPAWGRTLCNIPTWKVGNCGDQPSACSFALLTRLLLFPRRRSDEPAAVRSCGA